MRRLRQSVRGGVSRFLGSPENEAGLPGGSDGKESACSAGNQGSIPALGRSPDEGNGYPLQYSCLENPMDRGAWWVQRMGSQRIRRDWVINAFREEACLSPPCSLPQTIRNQLPILCQEHSLIPKRPWTCSQRSFSRWAALQPSQRLGWAGASRSWGCPRPSRVQPWDAATSAPGSADGRVPLLGPKHPRSRNHRAEENIRCSILWLPNREMRKSCFLDFLVLRTVYAFSPLYLITHGPARWFFWPYCIEEETDLDKLNNSPEASHSARSGRGWVWGVKPLWCHLLQPRWHIP